MFFRGTRTSRQASDQKMIDGTQQHFAQQASLTVGGVTFTPAQIVQMFADLIASNKAAEAASAQRTAAIKADKDRRTAYAPVMKAYRRLLEGMFADVPDTLASFGLAPLKVGSKSVAVKNDALAKSLATREARHTMGPKQKASIHGAPSAPPAPAGEGTMVATDAGERAGRGER